MGDRSEWLSAVTERRHPMTPHPTTVEPQLSALNEIRAVVFDIYGTLLISGSGDVGSVDSTPHGQQLAESFSSVGISSSRLPTVAELHAQIGAMNEQRKSPSCPKPEVDIVEAWRRTLESADVAYSTESIVRLACEYEARANPTWPMPGATELLDSLRSAAIPMGIVSNAQVFTIPLVEDLLLGKTLSRGGFDLNLCVFSNRFRQAKPGPRLFDVLRDGLARVGILPHQAVYVGNDMLNDVWAASQAGLRTAWFAGDVRSCRPREDDPRCRSLRPDVVLTSLPQLLKCISVE